jgi:hypothetical protein
MAAERRRAAALSWSRLTGRHGLDARPSHGRGRYPQPPKLGATRVRQPGGRISLSWSATCSSGLVTSLNRLGGDPGIERRGVEFGVAEQHLTELFQFSDLFDINYRRLAGPCSGALLDALLTSPCARRRRHPTMAVAGRPDPASHRCRGSSPDRACPLPWPQAARPQPSCRCSHRRP